REQVSALPRENVKRLGDRAEALTGVSTFEQLRIPLAVIATDFTSGKPAVFRSVKLTPALLATTAIPGVFPSVVIDGREHMDGGVVDNTQLDVPVDEGAKHILAISLMAGAENESTPTSWPELIARTLQLTLHHQMLSEYERLRDRARMVVLCPMTSPHATWEMRRVHLEAVMEGSREATR